MGRMVDLHEVGATVPGERRQRFPSVLGHPLRNDTADQRQPRFAVHSLAIGKQLRVLRPLSSRSHPRQ